MFKRYSPAIDPDQQCNRLNRCRGNSELLGKNDQGTIERGLVARVDPLFGAGREAEYVALYNQIVSAAGY